MRSGYGRVSLLVSLLVVGGCRSGVIDEVAPKKAALLRTIDTLAVAPTRVPEDLAATEANLAGLDSQLVVALAELGFVVVRPDRYAALWDSLVRDVGGLYDPYTGRRIDDRFARARKSLFAVLRKRDGAAAIVYPEVQVVLAPFSGGKASWDGVAQEVGGKRRGFLAAFMAALDETGEEEGEVAATSLVIFIENEAAQLYESRAGIELIDRFDDGAWVPIDSLFADPARSATAVTLATQGIRKTQNPLSRP